MKVRYASIIVAVIVGVALFSVWCAEFTSLTDFEAFYRTGNIILNEDLPAGDVYRSDQQFVDQHSSADDEFFVQFRYSMLAAYLFTPLALFSYDTANAIFIFINIIAYLVSVFLVLRSQNATGRWFLYPLVLSILWMPFIQNIRWGQVNALLLLFITVGILAARSDRFIWAGVVLAVATLFKPFALAVTMVMCIKEWRIAFSFVAVMAATLIILPGTVDWFHSFLWPPHPWFCYSAMYSYLNSFGPYYFWIYALIIGGLTAMVALYHREQDYMTIGSLAIPAAFLAMPVLEIQYPTVLVFTYVWLLQQKLSDRVKLMCIASVLLIFAGSITTQTPWILYLGMVTIWLAMIGLVSAPQQKCSYKIDHLELLKATSLCPGGADFRVKLERGDSVC